MLQSRSSVVNWLWTNNPFYFISALLMLYAVRSAYGEIEIGAINSWVMMGVLALYTSVLAVLGVMIVRWGRVWDDARSILLLLLLMFLAVSVSADDLFVRMESSSAAAALLGSGLAFSVLIFQFVLRGARIRLGAAFQIPFLLFLALFYITPWWCSPELHPRKAMSLDWTVFLFPQVAAVLCLTLLPAVRKGKAYVANNGTPWAWPWFPWAAFGCFAGAVLLRSYALTLTFSQSGPIWHSPEIRSGIVLDTIWRPYFIAPAVLAVMLLILEAGLVSGNRRLVRRVMLSTSLLLPMAWPWANTLASAEFLMRVTETVGSPLWLTLWMLVAFHGWALLRRVPEANLGLLGSALLLCVVGPHTNSISTLDLQPVALLMVSAVVALLGLYRRSTAVVLAASGVMTLGLWLILPETILISLRATTCYHALLAVCVALSLSLTDRTARILRSVISAWIPISALIVALLPESTGIPSSWRLLYIVGLAATCLACAQLARSKPYWSGFVGTTAILGYSLAAVGFRSAGAVVGRNAMAAFSWSIGTLLIGALISAYKAGWLPPLPWLAWIGGRPPQDPLPEIVPADPAGETSE
jgi:hypothetical protein